MNRNDFLPLSQAIKKVPDRNVRQVVAQEIGKVCEHLRRFSWEKWCKFCEVDYIVKVDSKGA